MKRKQKTNDVFAAVALQNSREMSESIKQAIAVIDRLQK